MIGSSENRISYNGNGIATEFAYTFKILEKGDLKVLHVAIDGTETLLVSDYYVDMEKSVVLYPGYAPGAEIPEQNRPPILPVGERLVLYREVPITQESALDKHWPFNVIENGLDKLTIICQQIWDRLQRSFYVSESTSTNFDPKVPIEAGKTFRVKDDGTGFEVTEDPVRVQQVAVSAKNDAEKARDAAQLARDTARAWAEENAGTTPSLIGGAKSSKQWSEHIHGYVDTAVEDARIAKETAIKSSEFVGNIVSGELYNIYSSVADMKADTTLMAGQTVKTVGYYEVNDGGGAFYYIRAKLTDDVDDGGSLHELNNGLVAELIVENGTVCPEQFGADGTVANDSKAFNSINNLNVSTVILSKKYHGNITIYSKYVIIDNANFGNAISFDGCNITGRITSTITLANCNYFNADIGDCIGVAVVINGNYNVIKSNVYATTDNSSQIIKVYGNYNTIRDTSFKYKRYQAIIIMGESNTVKNCVFYENDSTMNTSHIKVSSWGTDLVPKNTTIDNCTFYKNENGDLIDLFTGGKDVTIKNCHFYGKDESYVGIEAKSYNYIESEHQAQSQETILENLCIENCTFEKARVSVISHNNDSAEALYINNVTFVNCTFKDIANNIINYVKNVSFNRCIFELFDNASAAVSSSGIIDNNKLLMNECAIYKGRILYSVDAVEIELNDCYFNGYTLCGTSAQTIYSRFGKYHILSNICNCNINSYMDSYYSEQTGISIILDRTLEKTNKFSMCTFNVARALIDTQSNTVRDTLSVSGFCNRAVAETSNVHVITV